MLIRLKNKILFNLYLVGYKKITLPRSIRKAVAKTAMHRAWVSGRLFVHTNEQGKHCTCLTIKASSCITNAIHNSNQSQWRQQID